MDARSAVTSLLRHGPFLRFLYVRIAASVALQMQALAVGWQMYVLTGSSFNLGLVGLVQFIPTLSLFLVTGQVAAALAGPSYCGRNAAVQSQPHVRKAMSPARRLRWLLVGLALTTCPGAAMAAAPCGGDFDSWLAGVKQEAAAQGISAATIQSALAGVDYDRGIIARDHAQGVFHQSFEQFSGRMVPPRLARGRRMMQQNGPLLARIERQFGVPGAVIVAIWGLETDFGADNGRYPTIRALATLAYDCRRAEKFRGELLAALRIVERGDMTAAQMHGAWAGEIGQTQFLPSSYLKFAVDFDGNGRRDLIHSVPDVLASTANYLKGYGWHRGEPWGEGTPNFDVLLQWNASQVYTKTVAYFAAQLAGTE